MNEEQKEEVLSALEGAANFLRGACFDQRIPKDTRAAMAEKAAEIDKVAEKYVQ